jgi:CRISPR-associated protein Csb3
LQAECCPVLETICFIGLQRVRPAAAGIANRSRYTVWTQRIPANVVNAVVCGIVPVRGSTNYVFNNYFRTDHRNHKTFSQATIERS